MLTTSRFQPPSAKEVEVSLFGPGYGECVVVHVGEGQWLIVDSCIDSAWGPAALSYLRCLGVNPSQDVKWILATHWHDDHIRGLSTLLEECVLAEFGCSMAIRKQEFLKLIAAMENRSMMATTGVTELSKVLNILESRKLDGDPCGTPLWAIEGRLLWRGDTGTGFEIHALSPSDANVSLALRHLGKLLPEVGKPKNRIPSLTPNQASVALWIRVGKLRILLGGDLEETEDAGRGWSTVVACTTRPAGKAFAFKVAHHGSKTAEFPGVWTELLHANPIAMLTPFIKGSVQLPTETDVRRICSRSKRAFFTDGPSKLPTAKRPAMVTKTMRETVKKIAPFYISPGHVRLRANAEIETGDSWSVDLFNGAVSLHDQLAAKSP